MHRAIVDPRFCGELARRMVDAGISQNRLARITPISAGYLSQILNTTRTPSVEVARALDAALGAHGHLAGLVSAAGHTDDLDELDAAAACPRRVSTSRDVITSLERVLYGQQHLDDAMGSMALLRPAMAQVDTVARMVAEAVGPGRPELLYVAGQWARFVGWLHTSAGRWRDAHTWFATAQNWATELGDPDLIATVVSYQAHVAWLTGQLGACEGLSLAVLRHPTTYPGQRAYDAYQAGRVLAARGDLDGADRMIALGNDTAAATAAWTGEVPPWHYYRADWQWAAERGLVLMHAGRHDPARAVRAVVDLEVGVAGIADEWQGSDWAAEYRVHLATAHMYAGDLDAAGVVLGEAREGAVATASGRVLHMVDGRERRLSDLRRGGL